MNIAVAQYYKATGALDDISTILDVAISPKSFIDSPDEIKKGLGFMNINRTDIKKTHMESLRTTIQRL